MGPSLTRKSGWGVYLSAVILGILVIFGASASLVSDTFDGIVSSISVLIGSLSAYLSSLFLIGLFSRLKRRMGVVTGIALSALTCALLSGGTVATLSLVSRYGADIDAMGLAIAIGGVVGLLLGVGGWYGSSASRALLGGVSGTIAVGIALLPILEINADRFNQFLERTGLVEFPGGLLASFKWHLLGLLAGIVAGLVCSINENRSKGNWQRRSKVSTVDTR